MSTTTLQETQIQTHIQSPSHSSQRPNQCTPNHPQETLEVEDTTTAPADPAIYPSGLKLWLALSSVLMVALAKGLGSTPSAL